MSCAGALRKNDRKLISRGQNGVGHVRLAATLLSEQWALARIELSETAAPIRQILAERRLRAIEAFLRENLPHELPRSDSSSVMTSASLVITLEVLGGA